MREILTRELTQAELSLIAGGGETDQNNFGMREIWECWDERYDLHLTRFDADNNGSGWGEVSDVYYGVGAGAGVAAVGLAVTGNPATTIAGAVAALSVAAGWIASGIDKYVIPRMDERYNLQ